MIASALNASPCFSCRTYGGFPITITHSTFSENSALSGGGVYTLLDVIIANSTFSCFDATASNEIYTAGGTLLVTSSTIFGYIPDPDHAGGVGNALESGGGVYNAPGGVVTFFNTIVAGHDYGGNCVGAITNGGNNLDDGTTCGWGSANGSMSSVNPQLGALTGSPAYFPLAASSPAIDAGNNAICAAAPVNNGSQNGVARPTDGDGNGTATCDIGAVEREAGFRAYLPYAVR